MRLVTIGPIPFARSAVEHAIVSRLATLTDTPRLAVVYMPIDGRHQPILETMENKLGIPVVGVTTGGAAFTERGHTLDGVVVGLFIGDIKVRIAVADEIGPEPLDDLRGALRELGVVTNRYASVLAFADAFACDGEQIVEAMRLELPPHCTAFGGTAGDGWRFKETFVFHGGTSQSKRAVFVLIEPESRVVVDVRHGWCGVDQAKEYEITSIEANVLKALDHRLAADVCRDELRKLGVIGDDLEVSPEVRGTFELGVRTPFNEGLKVRVPLGFGDDGSLVLASSLRQGDMVKVVTASPDALIAAASDLSESVFARVQSRVAGAVVFDCAARLQLLGERYDEQVRAFTKDDSFPVLGVTCYGEIGRFGGAIEGFHNTTAVMAAW